MTKKVRPGQDWNKRFKDENAELRADLKFLMEQNSIMLENMERKPADGNGEKLAETSLSATNGQRIFTPEISNLITSVSELAIKNFETGLKLGREPENDMGMDKLLEFRN